MAAVHAAALELGALVFEEELDDSGDVSEEQPSDPVTRWLPRRSGHRPFSVRSKSGLRRGNLHTMHAEVSPPPRSHSQSRMKKARSMPSVKLTQEARWCGTDGRLPHCSNLLSVVILLLQVIILLLYFAFHCTGKGKGGDRGSYTVYSYAGTIND